MHRIIDDLTDEDLQACAKLLIQTYGRDAPMQVAIEIGRLATADNQDGIAIWKRIALFVSDAMGFEAVQPVTEH